MPKRLRVVLFGLGVIGSGVLRLVDRTGAHDVVGAVVHGPQQDGQLLRDLVPQSHSVVRASADGAKVLQETGADVAVIATRSTLAEVLPLLRLCASNRVAALCTAEDLAYITPEDSPEAREIFALADTYGVAIVGLGLNPGFLLDVWPLLLSSVAHGVTELDAERVVDLSGFGPHVRASLGVGYRPDDFERELDAGTISGHRGFRESLRLIGASIGRHVDQIDIETRPLFAKRERRLLGGVLHPGETAGVRQIATGRTQGRDWLRLSMTASVALDELDAEPVDRVSINGPTPLHATISPGVGAVPGTVGRIVNALPRVAAIAPGVHTALDLGITPARLEHESSTAP